MSSLYRRGFPSGGGGASPPFAISDTTGLQTALDDRVIVKAVWTDYSETPDTYTQAVTFANGELAADDVVTVECMATELASGWSSTEIAGLYVTNDLLTPLAQLISVDPNGTSPNNVAMLGRAIIRQEPNASGARCYFDTDAISSGGVYETIKAIPLDIGSDFTGGFTMYLVADFSASTSFGWSFVVKHHKA